MDFLEPILFKNRKKVTNLLRVFGTFVHHVTVRPFFVVNPIRLTGILSIAPGFICLISYLNVIRCIFFIIAPAFAGIRLVKHSYTALIISRNFLLRYT